MAVSDGASPLNPVLGRQSVTMGGAMKASSMVAAATLISLAASAEAQRAHTAPMTTARTSGVITIAGTPHPYLSEGTSLPCIVAGLAPFYPPLFSDRLKQRIRFIFVDFKNTWGAEALRDADKMTMDTLVEEIDDVRRALGLEKVCVVGHSAPGFLPLEFALRHPDRMSHGIVIGTPPFFNRDFDKVQSRFGDA